MHDQTHTSDKRGIPAIAWLTLCICLLATYAVWQTVQHSITEAAQSRFDELSENTHYAVLQRMLAYEQVLRGGIALFQGSTHVSRNEWHNYVDTLRIEDNFPGIQGIGFAERIKPEELQRHIAQIQAEGFPQYTVRPAGQRTEYTSIIYLEPFTSRNQRAFGYDMYSEPVRRHAMQQARDSGKTIVSGKVTLVQETDKDLQAGFLMYLPLYRKHTGNSVEERREGLIGYVYSPFRAKNLMRGILGGDSKDLDLEIFDGDQISTDSLMYDDDEIYSIGQTRLFRKSTPLRIQGHQWTLVTSSTPRFEADIDYTKSRVVAGAGLLLSLMLAALMWSISTNRLRAQQLADSMSRTAREREALLNAIVSSAADGIITIDEKGAIQSLNKAAENIFGYPKKDLIGKNINLLMPEPYHSAHDGYLKRYLQSTEPHIIGTSREVSGLRHDGTTFPMDLSVSEVRTDSKRLFAGIVRDISARKAAEIALKRSEERFSLAIAGANDGLWDWDLQEDSIYLSPRMMEMLGSEPQQAGDYISSRDWMERIHPLDRDRVNASINAHLQGSTPFFLCEYRIRQPDGHHTWMLSRGLMQCDQNGKPFRMTGIQTDISENKRVERLKSEFVATVSHELRTPLTSMLGSLQLVAGGVTGPLNEQSKNLIDIAVKNGQRLLTLINDILDMEKIQAGTMQYHMQVQPLLPLIKQAIENNQGYAQQYDVHFQLQADPPDCLINVDSSRFIQILTNLLSNAAKFSFKGDSIEIEILRQGTRITISVIDHGSGIPEEYRSRIFDKFSQADSSDTRSKGGTGLGLNIAKVMAAKMGGTLDYESTPGIGTRFFVSFPVSQAETEK